MELLTRCLLIFALLCGVAEARHGAQYSNSASSLGTNIGGNPQVEQMYLNYMKDAVAWFPRTATLSPTGETLYVYANCLDTNGYPAHMPCQSTQQCVGGTGGVLSTTLTIASCTGSSPGLWSGGTLSGSGIGANVTLTQQGASTSFTGGGATTYTMSSAQTISNGTTITESPTFTILSTGSINANQTSASPYYPSGAVWQLMYDGDDNAGSTNFEYHGDASFVSHSCTGGTGSGLTPCIDTVSMSPSVAGFQIWLDNTDTGSTGRYAKNFRFVQTAQYNALSTSDKTAFNACCTAGTTAGIYFNPDWLAQVNQFRIVRTMTAFNILSDTNGTWANRQPVNFISWFVNPNQSVSSGPVPIETMIAAANKLNADLWLNIPCFADDTYITNEANLVLQLLNPNLRVLVESCNEIWNYQAFNFGTALPISCAQTGSYICGQFPSCVGGDCIYALFYWRSIRAADIFASIWPASRLVRVVGGQYSNPGQLHDIMARTAPYAGSGNLWTGTILSHFDAYAEAAYWPAGFQPAGAGSLTPPEAWTGDVDGGMQRLYLQISQGIGLPLITISGNCGNGAGILCGGSTAYTASSALTHTGGVQQAGECYNVQANVNSSGSPTLSMDSGTAYPIQTNTGAAASLTAGFNYLLCLQASNVWQVWQTQVFGNCGNGLGITCGTSTALTLTTGQSLPAAPTNGTCVPFTTTGSQGGGSNPTLNVDGGGALSLLSQTGGSVTLANSTSYVFCFTNKTASGSVSAGWWEGSYGYWCGSEMQCVTTLTSQNQTNILTPLGSSAYQVGYEGGQGFTENSDTNINTLFLQFQTSPQIYWLYSQWLDNLKAIGLSNEAHFTDQSPWVEFPGSGSVAYWGFNPGLYSAQNNTPKMQALYDYARRVPCFWSGCRH